MKHWMTALLLAALLLSLTAGCAKTPEIPSAHSSGEAAGEPIHLERLTVEFAAAGEPDTLMAQAGQMPDKLKEALAQAGVTVDRVQVTIGASAAATAQALEQGGVDVAFLSAEGYVAAGEGGVVLLADEVPNPADADEGEPLPGEPALLCAAPTDYGASLGRRAANGGALTWDELDRARWGVLSQNSDRGGRYPNLWLADHYEGKTLSNLSQLQVYENYEALLRAASAGDIDIFPTTAGMLADWAGVWTMDTTRADEAGRRGFGRDAALDKEVTVLAVTERRLGELAVVRVEETLESAAFAAGLSGALAQLEQDDDLMALTGCSGFAPLGSVTLEPLRRLLALEDLS